MAVAAPIPVERNWVEALSADGNAREEAVADLHDLLLRGGEPMSERTERLERLLGPAGPDIGCEECFERLDEYVELELRGADAEARIPGMRTHLAGCPACSEEHESLRAFLS